MNKQRKDLLQYWIDFQGKNLEFWKETISRYSDSWENIWLEQGKELVQSWVNMQENLLEGWKNSMSSLQFPGFNSRSAQDMPEWLVHPKFKELFDQWWVFMNQNFGNAMPWFLTGEKSGSVSFDRMMQVTDVYIKFLSFWSEVMQKIPGEKEAERWKEINRIWSENYNRVLESYFSVNLPENLRKHVKTPARLSEMYQQSFKEFFEPWMETQPQLQKKLAEAAQGDVSAFEEVMLAWSNAFQDSYGKIFQKSVEELNQEYFEKMQKSVEAYMEYMEKVTELSRRMYRTGYETMEDYIKEITSSSQKTPADFNELYRSWWQANEDAYNRLFDTKEFKKLMEDTIEAWEKFINYYDEVVAADFAPEAPVSEGSGEESKEKKSEKKTTKKSTKEQAKESK